MPVADRQSKEKFNPKKPFHKNKDWYLDKPILVTPTAGGVYMNNSNKIRFLSAFEMTRESETCQITFNYWIGCFSKI
jgi:hypothetical protein